MDGKINQEDNELQTAEVGLVESVPRVNVG